MIVYGIKNCDSVKKALKYMKDNKVEYQFVDFKKSPVEKNKISSWLKKVDIDKLFNSRSRTYRDLKLKELNLDRSGKIEWMAKENLLIKRPIIELDDKVVVGVDFDEYDNLFNLKSI